MSAYLRPVNLDDALGTLGDRPFRILAGGTDVYPADAAAVGWGHAGIDHPGSAPTMDITALHELSGIRRLADRIEIGALVTWTEAIESELPAWFDCVRLAAREVGGRQIQNRGTIAGNLCNASPAADGVPALLVLNARVRLQRRGGRRELSLEEFITGNRRSCLQPGELMTAIVIPSPAAVSRSTFLKLGTRRYLVISIAMVAAWMALRDGARARRAPRRRGVFRSRAAPDRAGDPPSGRASHRRSEHGAGRGLCAALSPRRRAGLRAVSHARCARAGAPGARRAGSRGRIETMNGPRSTVT